MLQITLIQSIGWIAATFVLQGTSIFSEQLPGNFFLNVGIMGIVASLASLTVIVFNGYFSRQKFQAFTFSLTAICCVLCCIFQATIPNHTIVIVCFGILAKFAAQSKSNWSGPQIRGPRVPPTVQLSVIIQFSVAITVIYLFTVELFPTTMRSTGFSCCNIIARFAMIFLPLVLSASATAIWLPAALMGIISALGAISTMLLPDTKGMDLLEKLEDAEDFYSKHKLCCC